MAGTRSEFPTGLDLPPFADMPPQPGDVLVINVPDVVDAERADLAPRRVSAPAGPSSAATWSARASGPPALAVTLAALPLRPTEAGPLRATFLGGGGAWTAALSTLTILIVCHDVCSLAFVGSSRQEEPAC